MGDEDDEEEEDEGDDEEGNSTKQRDGAEDRKRLEKLNRTHIRSRKLFEGCISRTQCMALANEFCTIFGDDRVIDALMFTGQEQLGLYEILVSCAACASRRDLFESNQYI